MKNAKTKPESKKSVHTRVKKKRENNVQSDGRKKERERKNATEKKTLLLKKKIKTLHRLSVTNPFLLSFLF